MILFAVLAAVLAALVLAWALHPLFRRRHRAGVSRAELNAAVYRDQLRELEADLAGGTLAREEFERAKLEIERRLLEETAVEEAAARSPGGPRWKAVSAALAMPVAAAMVYLAVGDPGALLPDPHAGVAISPQQVEAMVAKLAERMKENPSDVNGWKLLGRSYAVLGRYAEAMRAYLEAAKLDPRDAQVLADLADVVAMGSGQSLQGEPEKLVRRALEIDPNNLKALALAGTAAFDRKDYRSAAGYWERMLPLVAPGSEDARTIQANVEEARTLAAQSGKPAAAPSPGVSGVVRLAPALKDKVAPEDTVFVFARAVDGPPMPLAVQRAKAGELPLTFRLDDAMAMSPAARLSGQPRVVVVARISRSGSASPQPGDLQGVSGPVANDAQGLSILIDTSIK